MKDKEKQKIRFEPKGSTDVDELIELGSKDPELGEFVKGRNRSDMIVFFYGDAQAGFAIPYKESNGRYRTGPIYVKPTFRRKGIAKAFVVDYFKGRRGSAWISSTNKPSQALYRSAGFMITDKIHRDGAEVLYLWVKDDTSQ